MSITTVKSGILSLSRYKYRRRLQAACAAVGVDAARLLNQAVKRNMGTSRSDVKGEPQAAALQEAEYRSGELGRISL